MTSVEWRSGRGIDAKPKGNVAYHFASLRSILGGHHTNSMLPTLGDSTILGDSFLIQRNYSLENIGSRQFSGEEQWFHIIYENLSSCTYADFAIEIFLISPSDIPRQICKSLVELFIKKLCTGFSSPSVKLLYKQFNFFVPSYLTQAECLWNSVY